jgi:hypothetical protein
VWPVSGEAWFGLGGVVVGGVLSYVDTFIKGRTDARNAEASKLYEQRLSVYVDAMSYAHSLDVRVAELTADPEYREYGSSRPAMEGIPNEDLITARLRLVAPPEIFQPWTKLLEAWRILARNLEQDGPHDYGFYYADAGRADVKQVITVITAVAQSLRRAMSVGE